MTLQNIPIRDEFDSNQGLFGEYDAYDVAQRNALRLQSHVNIRSFEQTNLVRSEEILDLDLMTMSDLDLDTMQDLEGTTVIQEGENWTAGVVGKQADRNHWRGINLACTSGLTTGTESVDVPIDLDTGFDDQDFLSLALPALPLSSINTAQSHIKITANPSGDFVTGPTTDILLNETTVALTNGDSEFRVLRSRLFNNLVGLARADALSAVTGVRFEIKATANCAFRCLAVRLLSKNWLYAPLDIDTLYERAESVPPLNGAASPSFTFPTATAPITPTDFPTVFWADNPPGPSDPSPVDVKASLTFNVGSSATSGATKNRISIFLREMPLDYLTQLDLDNSFTQADLDNYGTYDTTSLGAATKNFHKRVQPDFGIALFDARTQSELDLLEQGDLDDDSQFALERVADFLSSAFLEVRLEWNGDGATLSLLDSELNGYAFTDPQLTPSADYVLLIDLEDDALRARIFGSNAAGDLLWDQLVYDTTTVVDDSFIQRRKGRVGWYAHFADGDASLTNIRSRGMVHAEYRSLPYESITPVEGASVTTGGASNRDYYTGIDPGPWGGRIEVDTQKSASGKSFKIINPGNAPLWGIQTNEVYFDNFEDFTIRFRLFFPASALAAGAGLEAFLYSGSGSVIPLALGHWLPDKWQRIKILPTIGNRYQSGFYRLVLAQSIGNVNTEWYVDEISITAPIVDWSGRDYVPDPWHERDVEWVGLGDTINQPFGGVLFTEKRKQFQMMARGLQQDARLEGIRVTPQYAELGNFAWADQRGDGTDPPAAVIAETTSGRTATFDGSTSVPSTPPRYIVSWQWAFGDESHGTGPIVKHTYDNAGVYTVRLLVMDNAGHRNSVTHIITIP